MTNSVEPKTYFALQNGIYTDLFNDLGSLLSWAEHHGYLDGLIKDAQLEWEAQNVFEISENDLKDKQHIVKHR